MRLRPQPKLRTCEDIASRGFASLQPRPPAASLQPRPPAASLQPRPPVASLQPRPPAACVQARTLRTVRRSHSTQARPAGRRAAGFSLLEVILALGLFAGALVVLGELIRLGLRNAELARDTARAQLLCETKLAELCAGVIPAESVSRVGLEMAFEPGEPLWLYSIEVVRLEQQGLAAVRVTVTQDLPPGQRPVEVSLIRWIADPAYEENPAAEPSADVMSTGAEP